LTAASACCITSRCSGPGGRRGPRDSEARPVPARPLNGGPLGLMNYDSNVSPVGWYVETYQPRFIELQDSGSEDPERKFLVWENTVLVQAANLEEAYDKIVAIGLEHTEPYKGGPDGNVDVR